MELLEEWRAELDNNHKSIIVEGTKDKAALESLGVHNRIYVLSKKPLYQVIEDIAAHEKDIIILTDFDKKGKELYGRLRRGFEKSGVKVDRYFREFLQKNTKLSHMEGLLTYLEKA